MEGLGDIYRRGFGFLEEGGGDAYISGNRFSLRIDVSWVWMVVRNSMLFAYERNGNTVAKAYRQRKKWKQSHNPHTLALPQPAPDPFGTTTTANRIIPRPVPRR